MGLKHSPSPPPFLCYPLGDLEFSQKVDILEQLGHEKKDLTR